MTDPQRAEGGQPAVSAAPVVREEIHKPILVEPTGPEQVSADGDAVARHAPAQHAAAASLTVQPHSNRRHLMVGAAAIIAIALALYFAIPWVGRALTTVSTNDAYVNGHVTFVAARIPGQVVEVLFDDNQRVHKDDVLVRIDEQPYQVIVEAKRATLEVAKANIVVADDQVRAMVGQTRAMRFKLQHAIEDVDNQIALLRATVAALQTAQAKLVRAESEYQRGVKLQKTAGALTQEDFDQRKENYRVADATTKQALQQVYQIRVSLGLPEQPESNDLTEVPADLDQTFSSVRVAVADLLQNAAQLGITPSSYDIKPKQLIEEFYRRDPAGNLDRIYDKIIKEAPPIKLAQAKLLEAQADLDQAELNLSFCTVTADFDGVITRRSVNGGNNVIAGQSLMALRSLTDIWIDANFKETQLDELRIGQSVDLDVDMYGSGQPFKGRISGFTMGTGSTLSLLPAENATGNYVKVVQRLPVRIELIDYDPGKTPLFIGLSVTPYVNVKTEPSGKYAGMLLQDYASQVQLKSKPESKPEKELEKKPEKKPEKQP